MIPFDRAQAEEALGTLQPLYVAYEALEGLLAYAQEAETDVRVAQDALRVLTEQGVEASEALRQLHGRHEALQALTVAVDQSLTEATERRNVALRAMDRDVADAQTRTTSALAQVESKHQESLAALAKEFHEATQRVDTLRQKEAALLTAISDLKSRFGG